MKFCIRVTDGVTEWWEDCVADTASPTVWAEETIAEFNRTLHPNEKPRQLLEVQLEDETITTHDWVKTNLVTLEGMIDTYKCSRCGITAKRHGLGPVVRDSKFRAEKHRYCRTEAAVQASEREETEMGEKPDIAALAIPGVTTVDDLAKQPLVTLRAILTKVAPNISADVKKGMTKAQVVESLTGYFTSGELKLPETAKPKAKKGAAKAKPAAKPKAEGKEAESKPKAEEKAEAKASEPAPTATGLEAAKAWGAKGKKRDVYVTFLLEKEMPYKAITDELEPELAQRFADAELDVAKANLVNELKSYHYMLRRDFGIDLPLKVE